MDLRASFRKNREDLAVFGPSSAAASWPPFAPIGSAAFKSRVSGGSACAAARATLKSSARCSARGNMTRRIRQL